MSSPGRPGNSSREPLPKMTTTKNELERYKSAADHVFRQLDWCVSYLQGIGKDKLARALKQNRNVIAKQIGHD